MTPPLALALNFSYCGTMKTMKELRQEVRDKKIGVVVNTDWPMETVLKNIESLTPGQILIALLTLECRIEELEWPKKDD